MALEKDPALVWIRPFVLDGQVRWPPCEEREEEGKECLLSAKIDYRGKPLCQRHAASRLLKEVISNAPENGIQQ